MNIDCYMIDKIVGRIESHKCDDHNEYDCCEHHIANDIKQWLTEQVCEETGKLECGCSNDEFGCQGYHGT